ncbi:MAG: LysR substrate-binding domain-containing protein [Rhodospirillaceae bacterium]
MSQQNRRMPSMKALQVLECVARTKSFKDAAAELCVTPAAVSFQIRQLEKDLAAELFERTPTGVVPTAACAAFLPNLTTAMDCLHQAYRDFLACVAEARQPVQVTSGPAVMSKWLVPHVPALKAQKPELEIAFSAGLDLADLSRDQIDFAIRFGRKPDHPFHQVLAEEYLVPAISPTLAQTVAQPEDLGRFDLIHDGSLHLIDDTAPGWERWFQAVGLTYDRQRLGLSFSQSDHAIQAVASGAGIGLLRVILAGPELRTGRLVVPFGPAIPTGMRYYLLRQTETPTTPEAADVQAWLTEEIGHSFARLIETAQSGGDLRQADWDG